MLAYMTFVICLMSSKFPLYTSGTPSFMNLYFVHLISVLWFSVNIKACEILVDFEYIYIVCKGTNQRPYQACHMYFAGISFHFSVSRVSTMHGRWRVMVMDSMCHLLVFLRPLMGSGICCYSWLCRRYTCIWEWYPPRFTLLIILWVWHAITKQSIYIFTIIKGTFRDYLQFKSTVPRPWNPLQNSIQGYI